MRWAASLFRFHESREEDVAKNTNYSLQNKSMGLCETSRHVTRVSSKTVCVRVCSKAKFGSNIDRMFDHFYSISRSVSRVENTGRLPLLATIILRAEFSICAFSTVWVWIDQSEILRIKGIERTGRIFYPCSEIRSERNIFRSQVFSTWVFLLIYLSISPMWGLRFTAINFSSITHAQR